MDLSPARVARRFGTRKTLLRVMVGVLVVVVLWSAAWFYVPPIVAAQAERAAARDLGRPLSLGRVTFNPWTLELTITDLALAGAAPGAPPLLETRRVYADVALTSLLHLAPVIDRLEVEAPMLRVSRLGEGRYDFDDIVQRFAATPRADAERGPARFAVHNIVVTGGGADFVDQPLAATHRVRGLELAIPFISSLPSAREVKVEPHLAFTLDGSRFDSAGAATPFAERGNGELRLKLDGFSVAPYLGYLPHGLPAELRAATLSADVVVAFEQRPKLSLNVAGVVGASGIEVVDTAANDLLKVGNVKLQIDELRPLERLVRFKQIDIDAPHVAAARNAAGRVNLLLAAQGSGATATPVARVPLPTTAAKTGERATSATSAIASTNAANPARGANPASATNPARGADPASGTKVAKAPSPASGVAAPAPAVPWRVSVAALALHAGRLDWSDLTTSPAAALALAEVSLNVEKIAWPLATPVVFRGEGLLGAGAERGKLAFSGQGDTAGATVKLSLTTLPLAPLRPYLRSVLAPPLAGELSAEVDVEWRAGPGPPALKIAASRLALARLTLGDGAAPDLAIERIEAGDIRIDSVARTASIGRLALRAPRLRVERDSERRWIFERWGAPSASTPASLPASKSAFESAPEAASAAPSASATSAKAPPSWRLAVGELAIERGRVGFVDRGAPLPVALDVLDLAVQLRGFALDGAGAAPFHVAARVAVPAGPSGKAVGSGVVGSIDARGELAGFASGVPASARAALLVKDLPLHLLDPYLDDVVEIDVQKAQTSFKGDVRWARTGAGSTLAVRGDATIDDFRATNAATDRAAGRRALAMVRDGSAGRQLLNWKSLSLRGIELAMAPGTATRVSVADTALSDFFARIVLDENGRLNLQDITKDAAGAAPAAAAASAAGPASSTAVASRASPGPAAVVEVGPIAFTNGRVNFNDRFIKPNYTANLSELTGRLGAFSSQPAADAAPRLADLAVKGRVEGTASLDITGKLNPLAKPLALDIQAKVRDLELPPLSPYAIKYAGYGIERGKLSVDVSYLVKPDGQLTASNSIVLNQLVFGDKVEGAPTSLPVKLAVALLADRHGVINLDLPVSGSLNDPQFSLGAIIGKAMLSLIGKAITAPFSLLASAFSGRSESASTVPFAPGTVELSAEAREGLDKVAAALVERPQLTMTVGGESSLEREADAWKRQRLRQIVRAEKRRASVAAGGRADADATVSDDEYPALLQAVVQRADIARPKDAAASAAAGNLPVVQMEALLLANIEVGVDAMRQLAVRRGVVVRDYLAGKEVPTGRLFLAAPKTAPQEKGWTPQAQLKLAAE